MPKFIDITGKRFGKLVAEWPAGRGGNTANGKGCIYWLCLCDCGQLSLIAATNLQRAKSCGCIRTTHGHTAVSVGRHTPEYVSWQRMLDRCLNVKHRSWVRYGGRGITICPRWLGERGFENFIADMGSRPEPKRLYSLDRFPNNDGNYEPSNCRWASRKEQTANKGVA